MPPYRSVLALGSAQTPIQWVPRAYTPGVNQPGREPSHSLPSGAYMSNDEAVPTLPPHVFVVCLVISAPQENHDALGLDFLCTRFVFISVH
jgi:hypothetical protein